MGSARLFEDFGRRELPAPQAESAPSEEDLEDLKLKSFEQGYGAGWDDAVKAQAESGHLLAETVQQSLLDARMTREQAFKAFIAASHPLIDELVTKILPVVADRTLPQHVVALLNKAIEDASDLPVEIRVSPDQHAAASRVLDGRMPDTASLTADESLAPGQACFALGPSEKQIDLPELISQISEAVDAFYNSVQEEV